VTAGRVETVAVATAVDVVVASAWRDLLRSEGIEAELLGPSLQSVYPRMLPFSSIDVLVRRHDAERARRLIEVAEGGAFALDEDALEADGPAGEGAE